MLKRRPPRLVAVCTRALTDRLPCVVHYHGHPTTIVRDSEACVTMVVAATDRQLAALGQRLCDCHGRPIVEVRAMRGVGQSARPV